MTCVRMIVETFQPQILKYHIPLFLRLLSSAFFPLPPPHARTHAHTNHLWPLITFLSPFVLHCTTNNSAPIKPLNWVL